MDERNAPGSNLRKPPAVAILRRLNEGVLMVRVEFAASLRRHVECAPQSVLAGSLRAVLDGALQAAPELAHYVFDDQRHIRKHVAVFVNNTLLLDRQNLGQPLTDGDTVLVIQALTGG